MKTKTLALLAGVAMFGAAGVASADAVTMTPDQLDTVTAGWANTYNYYNTYKTPHQAGNGWGIGGGGNSAFGSYNSNGAPGRL